MTAFSRSAGALYKRFGIKACETMLQRVMSRSGLSARTRRIRKAKLCAGRANRQQLLGNLLNREFSADRPMLRMVTDVTYVPYFEDGEWHWAVCRLCRISLIAQLSRGFTQRRRTFGLGRRRFSFCRFEA